MIKISPKFGLNPSLEICPYCHNPRGVALLGRLPQDAEAPREVIASYEPCPQCQKLFDGNVLVLDVVDHPTVPNQPSVYADATVTLYPTFRFIVITKDYAKQCFDLADSDTQVLMDHQSFDRFYDYVTTQNSPENDQK